MDGPTGAAPRRILIVIRRLEMGGIQRASLNLAEALVGLGHEVHLLVLKGTPRLIPGPGITVHCVDFERASRHGPLGLAYHIFSRLFLRTLLPGSGFVWAGYSVSRRYARFVRQLETECGRFDLLLLRGQGAFELLWNVYDARCWQVIEGPTTSPNRFRLVRWLYTKLYAGKQVVCVSHGIGELLNTDLARHGVKLAARRVIHNPVPLEEVRQLSRKTVTPHIEPPYLVHVARLAPIKKQRLLLEAYHRADPGMPLVIIGEGNQRNSLQTLAAELGMERQVHFLGQQDNPYPWVARASAFVLSSKTEGLGLVLIEALALGTQCVVTDAPGGIREVLIEEQTRLIAEHSVESLATKIREALEDPVKVQPAWAERFDAPRVAEKFLQLIPYVSDEHPATSAARRNDW